jgi:hypothetical protein
MCVRCLGSRRYRWYKRLQMSFAAPNFCFGERQQELVDHSSARSDTVLSQQICYGLAGGTFVSQGENVIAPWDEVLKAGPAARLKLFDRSADAVWIRDGHKLGSR